ncbi:MAG: alpha/beta hydrolase [Deltaproteobacteria bacterium]|nr:alpha/beta hydrolase [Deltaproteobacteria bacterium]MBI3293299.1 alpha/beta hydrolase [Deltaproteobacteria bacterium]
MAEDLEKGIVESADGTQIYYEIFGSGAPMLLFNGLLCQRAHWRHQITHFSRYFQVVTFDYRGHNASGFPSNEGHLTLEWCARDGVALCEALGLKGVVLLGHSMGAPIAARFVLSRPELVKALVLICGTASNPFESMFYSKKADVVYRATDRLYSLAPTLVDTVFKRFTRRNWLSYFLTSQLGFNPNLAEERDVWTYLDGVHSNSLKTFYGLLRDYSRHPDSLWMKGIQCPTLMIAGEEDYVTPLELMETMAKIVGGARLEKIPSGSHNAHADLPQVVNSAIDRFLKGLA